MVTSVVMKAYSYRGYFSRFIVLLFYCGGVLIIHMGIRRYLGFSWASGIVTIGNRPYPNGRNQESVSEAIAAYEAIALLGDVMQDNYARKVASLQAMAPTTYAGLATVRQQLEIARSRLDSGLRIRDMGRLLMATEIRSAKTYWHVQTPSTANVSRIYPDVYEPKIVGMIWSMMVQEQTWFGNEVWKSYGIQVNERGYCCQV